VILGKQKYLARELLETFVLFLILSVVNGSIVATHPAHLPLLRVIGYVVLRRSRREPMWIGMSIIRDPVIELTLGIRWWTELESRPSSKALTGVIKERGSRGLDCS
jgi:hypothetical protein